MQWSILFVLLQTAFGIYKEQIGKFDWSKSNIGAISYSKILPTQASFKVVVGSERGVLALLKPDGNIEWRKVPFTLDDDLLYEVLGASNFQLDIAVYNRLQGELRVYSINDGHLIWSSFIEIGVKTLNYVHYQTKSYLLVVYADQIKVFQTTIESIVHEQEIQGLVDAIVKDDHIDLAQIKQGKWIITRIDIKDFKTVKSFDTKTSNKHLLCNKFICGGGDFVFNGIKWLNSKGIVELKGVYAISNDGKVFQTQGEQLKEVKVLEHDAISAAENKLFMIKREGSKQIKITDESQKLMANVDIMPTYQNVRYVESFQFGSQYFHIIVFDSFFTCFIQEDQVLFFRDESLAYIENIQFIELPGQSVHHKNNYLQQLEHHDTWGSIFTNFALRIQAQIEHLLGEDLAQSFESELERDKFGFSKLIVINTQPGIIFAAHSVTQKMVWRLDFKDYGSNKLVLQTDVETIVVARQIEQDLALISINSTSGQVLSQQEIPQFTYKQHIQIKDHSAILISNDLQLQQIGKGEIDSPNFHILSNQLIEGFRVLPDLSVQKIWNIKLDESETIECYSQSASKHIEQVAVATGDQRLLYKYMGNQMFSILTTTQNPVYKQNEKLMYIYIINGNNGRIVTKVRQDSVKSPFNLIQRQNWVVASYYNNKNQRNEILSIEMFQSRVDHSALDIVIPYFKQNQLNINNSSPPIVFSRIYVVPTGIRSIGVTETHQGITNQDIILVFNSGEVYSLSKRLLSPRRKGEEATDISEWDEPSLPLYKPVIPIFPTKVLNYYTKLEGLNQIQSTYTMLESTSLVVAYGLDLFVVRVMPEKTFDMLTEEYNFKAVVLTMLGMSVAIVVAFYYTSGQKVKKYFSE